MLTKIPKALISGAFTGFTARQGKRCVELQPWSRSAGKFPAVRIVTTKWERSGGSGGQSDVAECYPHQRKSASKQYEANGNNERGANAVFVRVQVNKLVPNNSVYISSPEQDFSFDVRKHEGTTDLREVGNPQESFGQKFPARCRILVQFGIFWLLRSGPANACSGCRDTETLTGLPGGIHHGF